MQWVTRRKPNTSGLTETDGALGEMEGGGAAERWIATLEIQQIGICCDTAASCLCTGRITELDLSTNIWAHSAGRPQSCNRSDTATTASLRVRPAARGKKDFPLSQKLTDDHALFGGSASMFFQCKRWTNTWAQEKHTLKQNGHTWQKCQLTTIGTCLFYEQQKNAHGKEKENDIKAKLLKQIAHPKPHSVLELVPIMKIIYKCALRDADGDSLSSAHTDLDTSKLD